MELKDSSHYGGLIASMLAFGGVLFFSNVAGGILQILFAIIIVMIAGLSVGLVIELVHRFPKQAGKFFLFIFILIISSTHEAVTLIEKNILGFIIGIVLLVGLVVVHRSQPKECK